MISVQNAFWDFAFERFIKSRKGLLHFFYMKPRNYIIDLGISYRPIPRNRVFERFKPISQLKNEIITEYFVNFHFDPG